jgi:hypothetical protein
VRIANATAALLLGILLSPAIALAQEPPVLSAEFFRLTGRVGILGYTYSENLGDIESDYTTVGPAWGVTATVRLLERVRFGVDYFGALATSSTETFDDIGTFMGTTVSQENDLEVDFHALDIEGGYSVLREPGLEWAVWLGWHYYFQGFERSNFRFRAAGLSAPVGVAPITEDVAGQGVKLGTTVEWAVAPRFTVTGALAGYYLYAVDVDNSDLGEIDSDGWAARWRIAVDYALLRNLTIGVGYEGHFIYVDQAESARAVLPANETWAHAGMLRVNVRY